MFAGCEVFMDSAHASTAKAPDARNRFKRRGAKAQRNKYERLCVSAVNPGLALDRIYNIHRISFILTVLFIRSKTRPVEGPENHGNEQDTEAHGHDG